VVVHDGERPAWALVEANADDCDEMGDVLSWMCPVCVCVCVGSGDECGVCVSVSVWIMRDRMIRRAEAPKHYLFFACVKEGTK
jgi:hypothetical protein